MVEVGVVMLLLLLLPPIALVGCVVVVCGEGGCVLLLLLVPVARIRHYFCRLRVGVLQVLLLVLLVFLGHGS